MMLFILPLCFKPQISGFLFHFAKADCWKSVIPFQRRQRKHAQKNSGMGALKGRSLKADSLLTLWLGQPKNPCQSGGCRLERPARQPTSGHGHAVLCQRARLVAADGLRFPQQKETELKSSGASSGAFSKAIFLNKGGTYPEVCNILIVGARDDWSRASIWGPKKSAENNG